MAVDNTWFTEECPEGGSAFSMKLKQKVYQEQTQYQLIEIYETEFFGTLMTLDGLVMLTDRDNFIYHEMMTHPAVFTHPGPRRVLVIGGGDCGTLREVLRHPELERVDMVEIDERVTRVSERFFPELCEANDDARARIQFTDGIEWVAHAAPESYDVIIVDSTDPIGPAAGLYSQDFYARCYEALGARGVLVAQSESPLYHLDLIKNMRAAMAGAGFAHLASLHFPQCSYPSGWWTATMACKAAPASDFREHAAAEKVFPTRYYNHWIHKAAMAAPTFFHEALG
ncbi:MAG: polyamine aminopropyltransferase [Gammaproteobacteria bacterium]|nr:MAG: polyamine aminopropyltransferase [Gammaproteobacteria bacterium]